MALKYSVINDSSLLMFNKTVHGLQIIISGMRYSVINDSALLMLSKTVHGLQCIISGTEIFCNSWQLLQKIPLYSWKKYPFIREFLNFDGCSKVVWVRELGNEYEMDRTSILLHLL